MAHQFKANAMEEQAEATKELIHILTKNHTCQMKALICSTTEAMKEMTTLVKTEKNMNNENKASKEEKKKKREDKHQKYNDALVCKNCGKKHPTNTENECWELEKNAASRPANWKSRKST